MEQAKSLEAQNLEDMQEEITPTQTPTPTPMDEELTLAEEAALASHSGQASGTVVEGEGEEEEAKAAVVLQSNYRGYKERKKLRERKKTLAGDELAIPTSPPSDDYEPELACMQEEEEQCESVELEGANQEVEGCEDTEQEAKAATVLQSNFRGHKERQRLEKEGKLPKKDKGAKSPCPTEEVDEPFPEPPPVEEVSWAVETAEEVSIEEQVTQVQADTTEVQGEPAGCVTEADEERAATVLQSNFRGHKERKKLQEEGKIPKKKEAAAAVCESPTEEPLPDPPPPCSPEPKTESELEVELEAEAAQDAVEPCQSSMEEEKAATVLQSNFRGHKERKMLKERRAEAQNQKGCETDAVEEVRTSQVDENVELEVLEISDIHVEHGVDISQQNELYEEEQAAVKIQSNFRGYKDRKNLKATSQREAEELEDFSKQVQYMNRTQSGPGDHFRGKNKNNA